MKVEHYNPVKDNSNCVVRSISKALQKNYYDIEKDLLNINKNYTELEVFEKYLIENKFLIDTSLENARLMDISLKGINLVLAHDNDWYHMVCVIYDVIYDKATYDEIKNMIVIKVYKKDITN